MYRQLNIQASLQMVSSQAKNSQNQILSRFFIFIFLKQLLYAPFKALKHTISLHMPGLGCGTFKTKVL